MAKSQKSTSTSKASSTTSERVARSEYRKGELFEQLMQKYFTEDPDYKDQFSEVYLWKEWAELQTVFDGRDIGVDSRRQKTRWRILCHPVQMLCPGYPNLKGGS